MEQTKELNKKKVIGVSIIFIIILICIFIVVKPKEKNGINAQIISETYLYSKPEIATNKKKSIDKNNDAVILESLISDNKEWYKIRYQKKEWYVLAEDVDYYKKSKKEHVLVADFSSHNMKTQLKNVDEIKAFLLNNDVSYVYIRAGGRGYGKEGKFYTDEKYGEFKKACEYLGIEYGYYFLDEALGDKEIDEEVKYIDNFMKKNKSDLCTLPVALDIEPHEGKGRCDDLWDKRSIIVEKLIKCLEKKEYKVIVYSNANTCNTYLSNLKTKFWLAYYPQKQFVPDYWYDKTSQPAVDNKELMKKLVGWQFTEDGVKHVINKSIDLSLFKRSFFE